MYHFNILIKLFSYRFQKAMKDHQIELHDVEANNLENNKENAPQS
jgi:hypothetical protein